MSHPQRHLTDLVSAYLAGQLQALVAGQSLFQGEFGLGCELGCLLVDTGGSRSQSLTTLQALVRGLDYTASRDLAWDVYEAVEDLIPDPPAIPQRLLGAPPHQVKVLAARAIGEPGYVGHDAAGFFFWSVNFNFTLGQKPRK